MRGVAAAEENLFRSEAFAVQYEVHELLGRGGFGTVYRATQRKTGQSVAVKVLKLDPEQDSAAGAHRFRREMQLCARLNHPNIVRLVDSGHEDENAMFTVFEYVPGETLRQVLKRSTKLAAADAKDLMLQVLDALECAHAQGILHRDLKPDNVMLSPTRRGFHAKLLDFGVATLFGENAARISRVTASRGFVGTFAYAAPEHLHGGDLSSASDLYSWGLTFLECLEGQPAIDGDQAPKVLFEQMSDRPVPINPRLERHPLGQLLRRVLLKDPRQRLGDASRVADELAKVDVTDLDSILAADQTLAAVVATQLESLPSTPFTSAPTAQSERGPASGSAPASQPLPSWNDLASVQADLARLRQQHALQARRRQALDALALRLRGTSGLQLLNALHDISATAADVLDVERVSIWTVSEDSLSILSLDLFERSSGQHSQGAVLHADQFPSYFQALSAERAIAADDVYSHEATRELLSYCSSLGISSMLDAPIWVGGRMLGVLCHEHVGTPRSWTPDECSHAASLADLASLALAAHDRNQLENVLSNSGKS